MGHLTTLVILFVAAVNIANAALAPTESLNDGNKIPIIALGTYGNNGEKMRQTVNWAVETGYRHIDTASLYQNEEAIGKGIADVINKGLVKREDLFITTKLWNDKHRREQVVPALRDSLKRLGLDYVDLYLIHSPASESPDNIDYLETWQGMEDAKRQGLVKSIGVSNFDTQQVQRIISNSQTKPAVNQVEIHPANTQDQLLADMHNLGVVVMAYSPFGFLVPRAGSSAPPPRVDDPTLVKMAKKYGKTVNQIVLRYHIQRGAIPAPKTANQARLKDNINVFDFQLTPEEVETINRFNVNKSVFE